MMFHPYNHHEKTTGYNQGCFSQIYKRRRICKNQLEVIVLKMKTKLTILLLVHYTKGSIPTGFKTFLGLGFRNGFQLALRFQYNLSGYIGLRIEEVLKSVENCGLNKRL